MALAVINPDGSGGFTITPATQADIDAFYAESVQPAVTTQVQTVIASEITDSEQRTWQRMVDADAATATNVETSLFGKIKAALQAALDYLGG
jgi:hypothetical protein